MFYAREAGTEKQEREREADGRTSHSTMEANPDPRKHAETHEIKVLFVLLRVIWWIALRLKLNVYSGPHIGPLRNEHFCAIGN